MLKPCPFCGKKLNVDDIDTVHASGTGWIQKEDFRAYVSFREAPKEQWCYAVNCPETAGGCGARIEADSNAEAIEKWNVRTAIL